MLEHVLKIFDTVIEVRVRKKVKNDNMKFGFMGGKCHLYSKRLK